MADDELRYKLSVDAASLMATLNEVSTIIIQIRNQMKSMADATIAEYQTVAKVMRDAFKAEADTRRQAVRTTAKQDILNLPLVRSEADPTAPAKRDASAVAAIIARAKAELKVIDDEVAKYNTSMSAALRQIQTEEKAVQAQRVKNVKELRAEQTKAAKEAEAELKQSSAEAKRTQQELDKLVIRFPVAEIRRDIQSVATQAGVSFTEAGRRMKEAFAQARQTTSSSGQVSWVSPQAKADWEAYSKSVNQGVKELKTNSGGAGSAIAAVTGFVGGLAADLGLSLISVLKSVIGYFKDAAVAAYDFSKALFQLQAGVNAMRRSGMEISTKDVLENIKRLRSEFGQFSTKELVEGTAQLINLTRDFGATKEQIFELQDAIVKLAIINGRAMDDVQRTVALALSSGYTEGLQRLGVSINRVTIAQKALELGYSGNYMALTELQRYQATEILILEKTSKYQDDLNQYIDTAPGKIDTAKASWADLSYTIGQLVLPVLGALADWINVINTTWIDIFGNVVPAVLSRVIAGWYILGETAADAIRKMTGKDAMGPETIRKNAEALAKSIEDWGKTLKEAPVAPKGEPTFTNEQVDAYEKVFKEMMDIKDEYDTKLLDAEKSLQDDYLQIVKDGTEKALKAWEDYQEKIKKINEDASLDVDKENANYADKIADLNRDTNDKLADASKKYHEAEIKAERDYQERMKRLREDFLLALEDALRERDALQVLRLIRKYNLDKDRAKEDNDQAKEDRAQAYRDEIADIQQQAQRKLEELADEHQKRLAEIEAQRQRELEEAQAAFDQEIEQQRIETQKKADDRAEEYRKDLEDLDKWLKDRLDKLTETFANTQGVTQAMANSLTTIFTQVFGKGGTTETQMNYFNSMLTASVVKAKTDMDQLQAYVNQINALSASILAPTQSAAPPSGVPFKAAGGIGIASTPTFAAYGEAGPELAMFTPLNRLGDIPKQLSSMGINLGGTGGGSMSLKIYLSAGLEGEIIDNALNNVAELIKGSR